MSCTFAENADIGLSAVRLRSALIALCNRGCKAKKFHGDSSQVWIEIDEPLLGVEVNIFSRGGKNYAVAAMFDCQIYWLVVSA